MLWLTDTALIGDVKKKKNPQQLRHHSLITNSSYSLHITTHHLALPTVQGIHNCEKYLTQTMKGHKCTWLCPWPMGHPCPSVCGPEVSSHSLLVLSSSLQCSSPFPLSCLLVLWLLPWLRSYDRGHSVEHTCHTDSHFLLHWGLGCVDCVYTIYVSVWACCTCLNRSCYVGGRSK